MTFPNEPLDLRVELYLGTVLGWVDVTSARDVYTRDPVTITRGRRPSAQRVDPGSCSLTLNNRAGKYSPRNPRSPYYGLLGRNTPLRVSVPGPESYLALDGTTDGIATTGGGHAFGLSAELDVRIEMTTDWKVLGRDLTLMGQYDGDSGDGWVLRLDSESKISLFLHTTGGSGGMETFPRSSTPEHAAFRIVWIADDGTGTAQNYIYSAPTLDGPWVQIGDFSMPSNGTMFDSALPVQIAPSYTGSSGDPRSPAEGLVHRAEVRSAVDGPVIAAPDFRTLAPGTTEFTDSTGLAWSVTGSATVTDRSYRFHGEVSEWPPRWDVSGNDVSVPITASGVIRRMGQGAPTLQSTLRRRIPGGAEGQPAPVAYWPMEEGRYATQAASPLPGVEPLRTSGLNWAANDGLFGSAPLPTLGQSSSISGRVPSVDPGAGWTVDLSYRLEELPASEQRMCRAHLTGSPAAYVQASVSTAGIRIEAYDADDVRLAHFLFDDADAIADFTGVWNRLQLYSATDGGDTYVHAMWRNVITGTRWTAKTILTGTPGTVTSVRGSWGLDFSGMAIGHLSVWATGGTITGGDSEPGITYFDNADDGYEGETAWARTNRLSLEEDVPIFAHTGDDASAQVGPQRTQSLLDLLEEAAEADGGLLYEHRRTPALAFRSRSSLYSQPPALVLDYAAGEVAPPLEPTDDDQGVANDVTVTRTEGSSGRAVLEDGPLSVQPAPDGIGLVTSSVTLNLADDSQTEPMAWWLLHLGTVDEARYPTVHVMLHAAPHLIDQVLATDVLDRMQILGPPEWLPPGTSDLLMDGYTETFGVYTWDITFNCSPGSPWVVATVAAGDGTDGPDEPNRCDTDGSVLAADAAEADTGLLVHAHTGPTWAESATYPGDFPFDVRVGGEVVRATAIGPGVEDGFGRTVMDGWGTAGSGQPWNTTGGDPTDYDVNGTQGTIVLPVNPGTLRFGEIAETVSDCEQVMSVGVDQVPAAGATYLPGLFSRGSTVPGAERLYWLNLVLDSAGTAALEVRQTVTVVASSGTLFAWAPGDRLWLRMRVDGHRVRGRAWHGTSPEPEVWHLDHVVADEIADGTVGVAVASTDATTTPTFTVDDYTLVTPQQFTVTRGINGLTKDHAAGAVVRLAQPAIVAL